MLVLAGLVFVFLFRVGIIIYLAFRFEFALACFSIWIASCACLTSAGVLARVRALRGSSARAIMNPRSVDVDCWGGGCIGNGCPGYEVK